jgi:hypothetical protein
MNKIRWNSACSVWSFCTLHSAWMLAYTMRVWSYETFIVIETVIDTEHEVTS